jgi:hypothetical protein
MGAGQDLQHATLSAGTRPDRSDESGGAPEGPASARTAVDSCEGLPPIGEIGVAAPEAPSASDQEINIGDWDRIALSIAPPSRLEQRLPAIITGALLSALCLGLGLGWIVKSKAVFPSDTTASIPLKPLDSSACTADPRSETGCVLPKADRRALPSSLTGVPSATKAGSQITNAISPAAKQTKATPRPTPTDRPRASGPTAPVPETRPTTIEGWTVRTVDGGTAVLEGPTGTWRAARGDTVPGVGKVDSIVRWGNHWIVATSKGLISTR